MAKQPSGMLRFYTVVPIDVMVDRSTRALVLMHHIKKPPLLAMYSYRDLFDLSFDFLSSFHSYRSLSVILENLIQCPFLLLGGLGFILRALFHRFKLSSRPCDIYAPIMISLTRSLAELIGRCNLSIHELKLPTGAFIASPSNI